jgi:PPK2 family polyphosphate:nucleotide phosphotransferase
MIDSPYLVEPGSKVHLSKFKTDDTGHFKDKADAAEPTAKHLKKLQQLQDVLYAQAKHAVLIVFQATDAGGKDGAIDHVFSGVNPQGCSVTSFKVPTALEHTHDYLWRIHAAVPPRGMIGIFNRSHYESVLVERVKKLVSKDVWKRRYDQINHFEEMLSESGVTILKFFLHISKDEQKKRLEARLHDKRKNWKLSPADIAERKYWDDYIQAYEDALEKCSTKQEPWFVVPSDHKWFRNWVISDTIVQVLSKMDLKYPKAVEGIEKLKVK